MLPSTPGWQNQGCPEHARACCAQATGRLQRAVLPRQRGIPHWLQQSRARCYAAAALRTRSRQRQTCGALKTSKTPRSQRAAPGRRSATQQAHASVHKSRASRTQAWHAVLPQGAPVAALPGSTRARGDETSKRAARRAVVPGHERLPPRASAACVRVCTACRRASFPRVRRPRCMPASPAACLA